MNIFNLSNKEFEEFLDTLEKQYIGEEGKKKLLQELIECGLEVNENDEKE